MENYGEMNASGKGNSEGGSIKIQCRKFINHKGAEIKAGKVCITCTSFVNEGSIKGSLVVHSKVAYSGCMVAFTPIGDVFALETEEEMKEDDSNSNSNSYNNKNKNKNNKSKQVQSKSQGKQASILSFLWAEFLQSSIGSGSESAFDASDFAMQLSKCVLSELGLRYLLLAKNVSGCEFEYDLSFSQARIDLFVDAFFPKVENAKFKQLLKQVLVWYYMQNKEDHSNPIADKFAQLNKN